METRIQRYAAATPNIAETAFLAPNATLIGDVIMASESSVWFQSVLRADLNHIVIGPRSNVQDAAVIHVADHFGTTLGQSVTVGHAAVLHACQIDDEVLVGMNAVVLDGAVVGARSIVGANALVTAGTQIPPGSLFLGSPGKVVRTLTLEEQRALVIWADRYVVLSKAYRDGVPKIYMPPAPLLPGLTGV
jgi:carbonic anhydrase/acetyltransferase-like protein (isoleucine patch superfamily)